MSRRFLRRRKGWWDPALRSAARDQQSLREYSSRETRRDESELEASRDIAVDTASADRSDADGSASIVWTYDAEVSGSKIDAANTADVDVEEGLRSLAVEDSAL